MMTSQITYDDIPKNFLGTRECIADICPDYTDCPGSDIQTQVCGTDCCPR